MPHLESVSSVLTWRCRQVEREAQRREGRDVPPSSGRWVAAVQYFRTAEWRGRARVWVKVGVWVKVRVEGEGGGEGEGEGVGVGEGEGEGVNEGVGVGEGEG